MAHPPLPKHDADTWDLRQAFKPRKPIHAVSARLGRVITAGEDRHFLPKAAVRWQGKELPDDIPGPAWFAAIDPRSHKYALSTDEGVHIFFGPQGNDRVAHVRPAPPGATEENPGEDDGGYPDAEAQGLAWGRVHGKSALFVAWSEGPPGILFADDGYVAPLEELPPMVAAAYDDMGTVAMLSLEGGFRVYVTRDGERYDHRGLDYDEAWYEALPDPLDFPVHLAVAGKAVAWSFGEYGAFVSRDFPDQPFVKCEPLAGAGALAFEGSSPDAALFGAVRAGERCSIVRVDVSGKAQRIGDLTRVDQKATLPFDELAWDASRKCLFAVHPEAGLMVAAAPDAKRGKLPVPS